MFVAISILIRVGRAAEVVWTLASDRATARRLPWPYLKHRLPRDARMIIQLAGIAAATIIYPLAFALPQRAQTPAVAAAVTIWLIAAFQPRLERTLLRRRSSNTTLTRSS